VENFLNENKINGSEPKNIGELNCFSQYICPEYTKNHLDLNREIVTWGQRGVNEVSGLLTCLLILFSQEEGTFYSNKIGQLFEGWRLDNKNALKVDLKDIYQVNSLALPQVSEDVMGCQRRIIQRVS
jgi:hypothetical protein